MPVTIDEKYNSRPTTEGIDNPKVELLYIVQGTDDDLEVHTTVQGTVPAFYYGLAFQEYSIDPLGAGKWDVVATYGKLAPRDTNGSSYQFDTGGGTAHITNSLTTIGSYAPAGQTAPNFKGAIGVSNDSVEGADVTVPVYNFSETHYIPVANVTAAYKAILFRLTGKVNNATFKGFSAGEVLFLGASGSQRRQEDWEITFKFAASPNVTNLVVGDITVAAKNGWDYLWIRYSDDESQNVLIKKPVAAYVERVYVRDNFADLGI